MDDRAAVFSIIVEDAGTDSALDELLHQYGQSIIGQPGIPCLKKDSTSFA